MPVHENDGRRPRMTRKKHAADAAETTRTAARKRVSKKMEAAKMEPPALAKDTAPQEVSVSQRPESVTDAGSAAAALQPAAFVADVRKPDPAIARVISREERHRMIAEAAYHKSLLRSPGNGSPHQDWYEAEAEIDALLAEQQVQRAQ